LGLVRELLPKPGTIAFVVNANSDSTPFQIQEMQAAAQAVGQPLLVVSVGIEEQVDTAFATMAERNVVAILYGASLFFQVIRERLVALAARYRIPALYEWREFVTAGGLMSYSTDRNEVGREAGNYAGRILKGEKPADLPVVQSSLLRPTRLLLVLLAAPRRPSRSGGARYHLPASISRPGASQRPSQCRVPGRRRMGVRPE
jgi:putative tryptophan/tyrosine transport system substrate-binding protein